MKNLLKGSWKTTSLGILTIIGAGVHLYFNRAGISETMVMESVTAVLAGIGLVYARDNDKSSEQVGVK